MSKGKRGFQKGHKCFTKRKGKTFEEICGEEKAKIWRERLRQSHIGQRAWNKGLTKETDERVLKNALKLVGQKRSEASLERFRVAQQKYYREHPEKCVKMSNDKKKYLCEHPEKHPHVLLAKRNKTGLTSLERIIGKLLISLNVEYEPQKPIVYREGTGYVKYVDFALPKHKLIIECDSNYWHQDKNKDDERDKIILKVLGPDWRIEHLSEDEIFELKNFMGINENE